MTVLVEFDDGQVGLFQSALGGAVTVVGSLAAAEDHLLQVPHEFAVLVGPSLRDAEALEFAERWRVRRPALSVILLRSRVDRQILSEAIRAGVREVLEARDLAEIVASTGRAHQLQAAMQTPGEGPEPPDAKGSIVTVFSTKGGVGKTTVAVNMAVAFAQAGKRACVVDADVTSGDVALMLHLFPQRTLGDLADLRGVIDGPGIATLLTEHSSGLAVLAAPLGVAHPDQVSPEQFGNLLDVLGTQFDVVVVDTAPSFDDFALQAIDQSDQVILVGTLDMLSLKNLKLALSTLDLLGVRREVIRLVLNREDDQLGLSTKDYTETLGLEATATVPHSRDVLIALNKGVALMSSQPKHVVSRAIGGLAAALLSDLGHVSVKDTGEARSRIPFRRKSREPKVRADKVVMHGGRRRAQ